MNFSAAIPTFVITLREGVEAALVVGIVLALLKKAKQSRFNIWVYAGVGVGIAVSALIGVLFTWLIQAVSALNPQYSSVVEPLLEGIFSILAIVMLSWMLLWMTQQAKFMKAQVEGSVTGALKQNSNAGWGVFTLIFIAVVREGFETVLFVAANFQQGLVPAIGALTGILAAIAIGVLLFKWGIKINIRQFFQVMGILLVLIVAGLVVTALGKFDQALTTLSLSNRASESLCFYYERFTRIHSCILGSMVSNTSNTLPDDQFPGVILNALFGYIQYLYFLQALGYTVFLLTVGGLYFRSIRGTGKVSSKNQPVEQKK